MQEYSFAFHLRIPFIAHAACQRRREAGGMPAPLAGRHQGFTLVEIMVTLAVMVILLAIAAPNMNDMVQASQQESALMRLSAALRMAQHEAGRRNQRITICPASAGRKACSDTAIGSGPYQGLQDWSGELIAFSDGSTPRVIDEDDQVLRVFPSVRSVDLFAWYPTGGQGMKSAGHAVHALPDGQICWPTARRRTGRRAGPPRGLPLQPRRDLHGLPESRPAPARPPYRHVCRWPAGPGTARPAAPRL
jgi:prepilin-type N-terminal cleavage/methylation domain-containing protein